jgi:putative methyltransferase (TIGR04325 family)
MTLKEVIKLVTPPVFIPLARRLQTRRSLYVEWEYIPEGWAYARTHPEVKGWNVQEVLETYKQKWPQFAAAVGGTAPLGVAYESAITTNENIYSHNIMMTFAYVLTAAALNKDRLSMLDWGGGIGHYYLLAQALLPNVKIEYHCKDVPMLREHGAKLFPQQHFHSDERCLKRTYDLVLASTSLHYTEDWQNLLRRLAGATSEYLYIANLPVVQTVCSFVFLQRPYRYGYNTEYLGWCLNQTEFLQAAKRSGVKLVREFVSGHRPFIRNAPEQNMYRGYLFRPRPEEKDESPNQ